MGEPFTLNPARWIGVPVGPVPTGAFALFRTEFELSELPEKAEGWILTGTRYRLWVNGRRVQWGPAPADPSEPEADPIDLRPFLQKGENAIGVEVLGDSSGVPDLIVRLSVDGHTLGTGRGMWWVYVDHHPLDSRRHPHGWKRGGFRPGAGWDQAREIDAPPALGVVPRSIPLMKEEIVRGAMLIDRGIAPDDLGRTGTELSPTNRRDRRRTKMETLRLTDAGDLFFVFELPDVVVGWPQMTIDAPAGTEIELSVTERLESDQPWIAVDRGPLWRWTSRGIEEAIEPFEFGTFRRIRLRIRQAVPGITIRAVGARRRLSDFPGTALLHTDDEALQTVFDASLRTLVNSAQDALFDFRGGELQQTAGDGFHGLHPVRTIFGGVAHARRFLTTFATGQGASGLWRDAWPPMGLFSRSRLDAPETLSVDRSIGFILDHYHQWMHTGDLRVVAEHWTRLEKSLVRLRRMCEPEGRLTLESLQSADLWMDDEAYRSPDEKLCAANLYLLHMLDAACELSFAVAPAGLSEWQRWREMLAASVEARFFHAESRTFVNNPDEVVAGGEPRFDERSLAHHLLRTQPGEARAALDLLRGKGPQIARSSPINCVWTFWALIRHGAATDALDDLRMRWAQMPNVRENGTLGDRWIPSLKDGPLSSCVVAPLTLAHSGLLGLRPTRPGYAEYEIQPQLGNLGRFETVAHTPAGAIRFLAEAEGDGHRVTLTTPRYGRGWIVHAGELHPLRPGMREVLHLVAPSDS